MTPPDRSPAALRVAAHLDRVRRRLLAAAWLGASSGAAVAGAVVFAATRGSGLGGLSSAAIALAVAGGSLTWAMVRRRHRWTASAAARAIERAAPASRNIVVTAEELLRHPERVRAGIQERVHELADGVGAALDWPSVVPLRRPVAVAAVSTAMAAAIAAAAIWPAAVSLGSLLDDSAGVPAARSAVSVAATITPPDYIAEAPRTIDNPERIEALEGSRVRLELRGAPRWLVRFGSAVLPQRRADGGDVVELTLAESGYLAIEPEGAGAKRRSGGWCRSS